MPDSASDAEVHSVVRALLKAHQDHCYDSPDCSESGFAMEEGSVTAICPDCGVVFFEGPILIDEGDA